MKLHKIKLHKINLILCNLYKKLCIKLVSIKELYYDARPTKYQDLHCKTSKTDIPLQEIT